MKSLGRELAAHDFFHVGVLVAKFDVLDLALLVAVFEDLVTGEGSALLNDPEPPADDALAVVLAPLAELGSHLRSPPSPPDVPLTSSIALGWTRT